MHKILMLIIVIPKVLLYYLGGAICLFNCKAKIQKKLRKAASKNRKLNSRAANERPNHEAKTRATLTVRNRSWYP